jgi:hypothetical protein
LACCLSIFGNVWLACEKYRLILRALGVELSSWEVILLKLGSLPLKSLLPFKSGELVRVVYLRRTRGVSYAKGGASVILNLGCTLLALGLLMTPGLLLPALGWWAGPAVFLVFLLPVGLARQVAKGQPSPPDAGQGRLGASMERVRAALGALGTSGLVQLWGYSVAFEGIKVVNYGILFLAMGILPSWEQISRAAPLLILFSSLPISVMGFGIREGGMLLAFARNASEVNLVSTGLWVSVVEGVVPLLVGLLLLKPFFDRLVGSTETAAGVARAGGVARRGGW